MPHNLLLQRMPFSLLRLFIHCTDFRCKYSWFICRFGYATTSSSIITRRPASNPPSAVAYLTSLHQSQSPSLYATSPIIYLWWTWLFPLFVCVSLFRSQAVRPLCQHASHLFVFIFTRLRRHFVVFVVSYCTPFVYF